MTEQDSKLAQKDNGPDDAQFLVQKVYVKDISFETPNTPEIFKMEWHISLVIVEQLSNH